MMLDPAVFWAMSFRDFKLAQRGFFELRNEQYKSEWEQARFISFWAMKSFRGGKDWPRKMKDIVAFEWENDNRIDDVDDMKEQIRYWTLKYGRTCDMEVVN